MTATLAPPIDLFELLGDKADTFEMIRGVLREVGPMGGRHGAIGGDLHGDLANAVRRQGLGQVFTSDTHYEVIREPRTVLMPDISVVLRNRLPDDDIWVGVIPLAPDLAVEVVSPSNREPEILDKVALYLAGGTRLVWLIRPDQRTVTVFRPDQPERVLTLDDDLEGEDVLPGFRVSLTSIFRPRGRLTS